MTAVNDDFGNNTMSVNEWEQKFLDFMERSADDSKIFSLASYRKRKSFVSMRKKKEIETSRGGIVVAATELTRRYFKNLFFNPGILGTRIAMYLMLALMVGSLFWDLGERYDYSSIQSRIGKKG